MVRLRSFLAAIAILVAVAVSSALSFASCGSGSSTSPNTNPSPIPTATPTPIPTPTPLACSPTPPPLYTFQIGTRADLGFRKVLDATPLVENVNRYCEEVVGVTGRWCLTREEGHPQKTACDYMATGNASDTGRPGPTWTWNDKPCLPADIPAEGTPGCQNHQDNQFFVIARGPGFYMACGQNGSCGTATVK